MRYLSGIQPSGSIHIGNYFGAMRQHVARQEDHECFYFIADLHALTTIRNAEVMRTNTLECALAYLAIGLDPARAVFFRQSDVPEVSELSWILTTVTPMGVLERAVSYKEKKEKGIPADHGLFAYPVLMASDILIYDSNRVPVGQDQIQHVEICRDIARIFNNTYVEALVVPEYEVEEETAVVPGTDGQKMSKSYDNHIEIFAPEKRIRERVMRIVTDSRTVREPKDPETCNVFALYRLLATREESQALADRYRAGGMGYAEAKRMLLEKILSRFEPYRKRRDDLLKDPGAVLGILAAGGEKARAVARVTLDRVRKAVGVR